MSARANTSRAGRAAPRPAYRMRPAPRTGPRMTRIRWDKAGRVALVLVLFLILAAYVKPVIGFVDAWRQDGAEQQTLTQLQAEHEALKARAAELAAPDAGERAARELGMVRAGEQAYVIESPRD